MTKSVSADRILTNYLQTYPFMADGRTCEEWFFVFENALHANSIPPTVILSILSTFLKGTALHLLKNYMDSGKTDWLAFKEVLRTTFLPKDHKYRLRVQLIFPRFDQELIKDQLGIADTIIKNEVHDDMEATVIKTEKTDEPKIE